MIHSVLRTYLAIARVERFNSEPQTRIDALRALELEEWPPAEIEYQQDEQLTRFITESRGIDADEQYRLGITACPSRLQNRFICADLIKRFGLEAVTKCPHFNAEGILQYDKKHDFIFPVKKGKRIERFDFYTIGEMRKWGKPAAARELSFV